MKTINLNIKGMHCTSCETLITDSLREEKGVNVVEISHKTGKARILFNESLTNENKLKDIIKKEGYAL